MNERRFFPLSLSLICANLCNLWIDLSAELDGPVSVEAISATLNAKAETLVDMVEPCLLQQGFISRTKSGTQGPRSGLTTLKPAADAARRARSVRMTLSLPSVSVEAGFSRAPFPIPDVAGPASYRWWIGLETPCRNQGQGGASSNRQSSVKSPPLRLFLTWKLACSLW
ncbi:MAG: Holliday junction DNA helicase RuvB C-terminal domain-containing protein [Terriglobia bacterium]